MWNGASRACPAAVVGVQMVASPVLILPSSPQCCPFAPWMMLSGPGECHSPARSLLSWIAALTFSLTRAPLLILPAQHCGPTIKHAGAQGAAFRRGLYIRAQASLGQYAGPGFAPQCVTGRSWPRASAKRYRPWRSSWGCSDWPGLMNSNRVPFHFNAGDRKRSASRSISSWPRARPLAAHRGNPPALLRRPNWLVQEAYREEFPGEIDVIRNRQRGDPARSAPVIGLAPAVRSAPDAFPSRRYRPRRIRDALGAGPPDAEEIRF